jgi:hypothetical protein
VTFIVTLSPSTVTSALLHWLYAPRAVVQFFVVALLLRKLVPVIEKLVRRAPPPGDRTGRGVDVAHAGAVLVGHLEAHALVGALGHGPTAESVVPGRGDHPRAVVEAQLDTGQVQRRGALLLAQ